VAIKLTEMLKSATCVHENLSDVGHVKAKDAVGRWTKTGRVTATLEEQRCPLTLFPSAAFYFTGSTRRLNCA
jgi:hypothetical protein